MWELRLPAGAWDEAKGPVIWGTTVRPPKGLAPSETFTRVRGNPKCEGEVCYFFQVDGESFSKTILFGVIIEP